MIYVILDTNVVVSAMLSRLRSDAATAKTLEYVFLGKVVPVYNDEIIDEYIEVLSRPKFRFDKELINIVISHIRRVGISSDRLQSDEEFPDKDDVVFYEVTLSQLKKDEHTYLVTGNLKHFPMKSFVVTPREFVEIVGQQNQ
jgi:predicted nucleic acid-binding protein